MKILICGASGFIGAALDAFFTRAGHQVIRGVRQTQSLNDIAIDFSRDFSEAVWLPRLQGIDVVINAVGILVEDKINTFDAIHHKAPSALFSACVKAGVKRIIQISALGAETSATPYFSSKRAAENHLMALPIQWQIVRPSLVYGEHGFSARFFMMQASLPILFLPAGHQLFQPIHLDDLVQAIEQLSQLAEPAQHCIDFVGATSMTYGDMLKQYRTSMGLRPAPSLVIPKYAIKIAAYFAQYFPSALLTPDTLKMFEIGNVGDVKPLTNILAHSPKAVENFIAPERAEDLRNRSLKTWQTPLLKITLAAIWILTAFVSVFIFPMHESFALLAQVGLNGYLAVSALYLAASLDFMLGLACLLYPCQRLWQLQISLILIYTGIIAIYLPEFLWHPFGPILKNLAIITILILLLAEETDRGNLFNR